MRIEPELKLNFDDVLLRPKRSKLLTRSEVNISRTFKFKYGNTIFNGVPLMAANMAGVGTIEMAVALSHYEMFTCLTKTNATREYDEFAESGQYNRNFHAISIGISKEETEKFNYLHKNHDIKYVCIDVANGYSEGFVDRVRQMRETYPDLVIIAGNVVTGDMTEQLILAGADIVKIGIGPGSVCSTRIKTGVGYPQLSSIIECADAAHGLGGHVISDGGCRTPGDIVKAFAAGADFVMLGGMLAGHNEGGQPIITKYHKTGELKKLSQTQEFDECIEEKKYVEFYGMSSAKANENFFGGLKNYRTSEGRESLIPYKGDVDGTIMDILGGMRSACSYVGASSLKELSKRATFIRTNQQYNDVFEKTDQVNKY